jgi:hypothetical protein
MILYTPVPVDYLLSLSGKERNFKEIPYGDATIVAEVMEEGTYQVVRVISSNPDDYITGRSKKDNWTGQLETVRLLGSQV